MNSQMGRYALALTVITLILLAMGMANLYSAGYETMYFSAQLRHLAVGVLSFIVFARFIPLRLLNTMAYPACGFISLCLLLVLLLGYTAGGAKRWLILGPIRVQPSEFAKITLVLGVAKFFYLQRSVAVFTLHSFAPILALAFGTFIVIFKQPDFGTAGICLIIVFAQLAFVRIYIGWRMILAIGVSAVSLAVAGWSVFLRPYQKLRILNLLNPELDPAGSGYNSLQSLIAIGSGKQFGKGFLQGTQTQLQFLPARHTDFIFSVFAEEHGFWGSCVIFLLFALIALIALEIARTTKDTFAALVAIGIGAFVFVEYALNVAMVLGIFPVVGMPLPFFSYGGTAMLTSCIALGMLVGIARESATTTRRKLMY